MNRITLFLKILILASVCVCNSETKNYGNGMKCSAGLPYSQFKFKEIIVRVFEPDDTLAPKAWQGPLCIAVKD